jgi:hypothetical protein
VHKIDWITSVKPVSDTRVLLEENCLLSDFYHEDCRLVVVNSIADKESLPTIGDFASLKLVNNSRPTLFDLLSASTSRITILSNADIRVVTRKALSDVIDQAVPLSVCRRYDLEFIDDSFSQDFALTSKLVQTFGYLQSRFTLDFFVISPEFREHLLRQNWTSQYSLGQSGVDMAILNEGFQFGSVARLDRFVRLLHKNHESFKVSMPVNIVINLKNNKSFSKNRSSEFGGIACSMIFSNLPSCCFSSKVLRGAVVRLDLLSVKFRNGFQYTWSKINFFWANLISRSGGKVTVRLLGKLWYFAPAGSSDDVVELDRADIRRFVKSMYSQKISNGNK